jgi:hypothetical protein
MKQIFAILLIFILAGCNGSQGTNTGNPTIETSNPNFGTDGRNGVVKINETICAKIQSCESLNTSSYNTCLNQLPTAAGFTDEIDLNPPYADLSELRTASENGQFNFNETSLSQCLTAITNLSCSDPLLTSAYSSSQPNIFTKGYFLFRASTQCLSLKN